AQRAGAESYASPPLAGMIDALLERTRRAHANPVVPGEGGRNRIDGGGQRLVVTPTLVREGVDFLDLADDPASDERFAVALRLARRHLDPHLRRQTTPARLLCQQACLVQRVAERLLHVDGLAE